VNVYVPTYDTRFFSPHGSLLHPSLAPPSEELSFILSLTDCFELSITMTSNNNDSSDSNISFYEDPENLKKLCNFLRSSEGPPVREAIEMEKRVYYLKGTSCFGFCALSFIRNYSVPHIAQTRRKARHIPGGTQDQEMALQLAQVRHPTRSDCCL